MIKAHRFSGGEVKELSVDELQKLNAHTPMEGMIWVDLYQPTEAEEQTILVEWFGVGHLALHDARQGKPSGTRIHFPKVEERDEFLFVILRGSTIPPTKEFSDPETALDRIRGGQLTVFLNKNVLITHRWIDMGVVDRTFAFLSSNPQQAARGPDFAVAALMDKTIDDVNHIAEIIEEQLEHYEVMALKANSTEVARKLLKHRKRIFLLRRFATYQKDLAMRLGKGEYRFVDTAEAFYYKDVYDQHLIALDALELHHIRISGLMDVYFSMSSNRLNQVMRILTVISTIFLPITFITSWYGMNFEHMPELSWPIAYPVVISVIVMIAGAMLLFSKRRGWLE